MGNESEIDKRGIGDALLSEYASNGYNYTATARKFGLQAQTVMYYVEVVKKKEPDRWAKAIANTEIDVVRKLTGIINRVEKKMDAWENDETKEAKFLIAIKEARDNLKFYVDCLEKLFAQKQATAFRKAVLEVIKTIDPEVAQKIIQRIKEISDLHKLLGE